MALVVTITSIIVSFNIHRLTRSFKTEESDNHDSAVTDLILSVRYNIEILCFGNYEIWNLTFGQRFGPKRSDL